MEIKEIITYNLNIDTNILKEYDFSDQYCLEYIEEGVRTWCIKNILSFYPLDKTDYLDYSLTSLQKSTLFSKNSLVYQFLEKENSIFQSKSKIISNMGSKSESEIDSYNKKSSNSLKEFYDNFIGNFGNETKGNETKGNETKENNVKD